MVIRAHHSNMKALGAADLRGLARKTDESIGRPKSSERDRMPIESLDAVCSYPSMRRRRHGYWGEKRLPRKLGGTEGGRKIGSEEDEEGDKDDNDAADGEPFPEI